MVPIVITFSYGQILIENALHSLMLCQKCPAIVYLFYLLDGHAFSIKINEIHVLLGPYFHFQIPFVCHWHQYIFPPIEKEILQ